MGNRKYPLPNEGDRFERLTVIGLSHYHRTVPMFNCSCECGAITTVTFKNLRTGMTRSCGCLRNEALRRVNRIHGGVGSRLYVIWCGIKSRCEGKPTASTMPYYKNYGGRGIKVCAEWRDNFQAFKDWALSHGYKDGLQIDRVNNDGHYEPSNCRWVTVKENSRNKRTNIFLTAFGETKPLEDWHSDPRCLTTRWVLRRRIKEAVMTPEEAMTLP